MSEAIPAPAIPNGLLRALEALHRVFPEYGTGGSAFAVQIVRRVRTAGMRSVLDYGCGKGRLVSVLAAELSSSGIYVGGYDPAVPSFANAPYRCDLVVCIDVLDSIPPRLRTAVLSHIAACCRRECIIAINVDPASLLTSAAGEVIQRCPMQRDEWSTLISDFFSIRHAGDIGPWWIVVAEPRRAEQELAA